MFQFGTNKAATENPQLYKQAENPDVHDIHGNWNNHQLMHDLVFQAEEAASF